MPAFVDWCGAKLEGRGDAEEEGVRERESEREGGEKTKKQENRLKKWKRCACERGRETKTGKEGGKG